MRKLLRGNPEIIEDKGNVQLHPTLRDAFSKIHRYTNDTDGIMQ